MSYYCGHPKAEQIPVYRAYALVDKIKEKRNNDYMKELLFDIIEVNGGGDD